MNPELQRMVRHGVAPLVVYGVSKGWLPEFMQNDAIEFAVIGVGLVVAYVLSKVRERAT